MKECYRQLFKNINYIHSSSNESITGLYWHYRKAGLHIAVYRIKRVSEYKQIGFTLSIINSFAEFWGISLQELIFEDIESNDSLRGFARSTSLLLYVKSKRVLKREHRGKVDKPVKVGRPKKSATEKKRLKYGEYNGRGKVVV